ncbi:class F sortase [Streptomyces sp. DSM 42041]|uniref:Class F sortase n=1 Tax=Streptomyces hazeniae TaxID=3075538 RepID=A0ABU2NS21_9ACTN|nr:class F sortase [Streptomyces sp. DSM 42041]MDT0379782.1 class F sortase [Streptomyces sp. DSM 42041]
METCVSTLVAASACAAVWLFDHGTDGQAPPQPPAEAGFARDAPRALPDPETPAPTPSGAHTNGRDTNRQDTKGQDTNGRETGGRETGGRESLRPERSRSGPRASDPLRVRIPSIGVSAPLTRLGLHDDGSLEAPPPQDENLAGWYADGTPPGAVGTAIVAGHVDTADGPAVFYGLGALRKGAEVEIERRDGFTAVFTLDAVEVYDGAHFPDTEVYGPSARPELRLITCGGTFDEEAGEYTGNVVVFAHLTDVRRTVHQSE